MACHRLDMAHLYSLLITKLSPSWKIAISGDRTIQLLFSPVRNEKHNVNERQILLAETGTVDAVQDRM